MAFKPLLNTPRRSFLRGAADTFIYQLPSNSPHPSRSNMRAATSAPDSVWLRWRKKLIPQVISCGVMKLFLLGESTASWRFAGSVRFVEQSTSHYRTCLMTAHCGLRVLTRSCVRSSRKDSRMWYVCYRHSVDDLAWQFRSPAASRERFRVGAGSLRSGNRAVCSNA